MPLFRGSGVALVTPFTQTGLNLEAYRKFIEWHIEQGTDALIACGTTGEASTMTDSEKDAVIECAVKTSAGRVPVIAGVGGNNTAHVIDSARRAKQIGADGLLAVTPYYNKTTQKGLTAHYNALCDAADLPVIVYNVPSRTGLNVTAATYRKIADHPNIAGIKEASGDISQIVEMARLVPEKALYSGNDDQVLPLLALGGMGVITTVGNVAPKMMRDLCAKWFAGDIEGARVLQLRLCPLITALFRETNPIPVKTALNMMGKDAGPLRLPLVDMEPSNAEFLRKELMAIGALE